MGKEVELISAIKQEDVALIQKILSKNCLKKSSLKRFNINHQDNDGMSPFHQAILTGNVIIIKLLLDYGAAIDSRDGKGMRPLHYASWQGKDLPIKVLLRVGSSVNEQALDGNTPLHFAAEHGHISAVIMLLQHDADVTIKNKQYKTSLDLACEFGRIKVVDILLNNERSIDLLRASPSDVFDNEHTTCLHLAARNGHVEVISLLLEHGMDINRQTLQGTCLHEAAKFGKTEVVRLLLSHGIDASRLNSYEQTALEIVNKFTPNKGAKELKQLLKEASSDLIAQAVHDYTNAYDPSQLSFKEGDQIIVIERSSRGGMWKGYIRNNENQESRVGYFPANAVFVLNKTNNISEDLMQKSHLSSHSLHSDSSFHQSPNSSSSQRYSYHSAGSSGGSSGNGRNSLVDADDVMHNFGNFPDLISQGLQDHEIVTRWLTSIHLEKLVPFFENASYDLPSISKMTPEDLNAIGITQPEMRNRLKVEIRRINVPDGIPDYKPADLTEWLRLLKMPEYSSVLNKQGYKNLDSIKNLSWEDYEDIGIKKLGHQKKFTLAIERLKRIDDVTQRHSLTPTDQCQIHTTTSIPLEAFNRPPMELPPLPCLLTNKNTEEGCIVKISGAPLNIDDSQLSSELKNMQMPLFNFSYSTLPRSIESRRLLTSNGAIITPHSHLPINALTSPHNNYDYIYPQNSDQRSHEAGSSIGGPAGKKKKVPTAHLR